MLRSEHCIVRYDFDRKTVTPDRLKRDRDQAYVPAIQASLLAYQQGIGKTRQSLHRTIEKILVTIPGCPPRRISAFCKLLDDLSDFTVDNQASVALRKKVFEFGAKWHPIVQTREGIFEHDLETARSELTKSLGKTWDEIESMMFADVIELQPLRAFDPMVSAIELLSTYNLAQTQAALYKATEVRVDAFSDFKTIVRHAKLARLMHRIERLDRPDAGYRFQFDGPGSTLRETTRYGIGFAKLLGKLVTCGKWQLTAHVLGPRKQSMRLTVSPKDGLRSSLEAPHDFDSELEREVEVLWNKAPVPGWVLERETELLHIGQTVLTPDFVLRSNTGRVIMVEVVGFWTPEYLHEKVIRLKQFMIEMPQTQWLLMFPKSLQNARDLMVNELEVPAVTLDRIITPSDWIAAINGPSGGNR